MTFYSKNIKLVSIVSIMIFLIIFFNQAFNRRGKIGSLEDNAGKLELKLKKEKLDTLSFFSICKEINKDCLKENTLVIVFANNNCEECIVDFLKEVRQNQKSYYC